MTAMIIISNFSIASAFRGMKIAFTPSTMRIRITQVAGEEGIFLRVDGHLDCESLGELDGVCREALSPLTLNIEGVRWIDDHAAAYLHQLIAEGAAVTNASPYVALRLEKALGSTLPKMTKKSTDSERGRTNQLIAEEEEKNDL